MSANLVFPKETPTIAKTVYDQIVKLRALTQDMALRGLKRVLSDEDAIRLAMTLINDDVSQMRLVAHLPDMVFEELRAVRLMAARMNIRVKEASRPSSQESIERAEFVKLVDLVAKFPAIVDQTKIAILDEVEKNYKKQNETMGQQAGLINQVSDMMQRLLGQQGALADIMNRLINTTASGYKTITLVYNYLVGFGAAHGYKDPVVELEAGIARSLRG